MYNVDFIVHLHGKFALCEELIVQNFKNKKIGQSSTVKLSMCEEHLCVF